MAKLSKKITYENMTPDQLERLARMVDAAKQHLGYDDKDAESLAGTVLGFANIRDIHHLRTFTGMATEEPSKLRAFAEEVILLYGSAYRTN
jgi:hypothetical protein